MIINVLCVGNDVIEKNKNRIRRIKLNQQRNCKIIDILYNQSDYEAFKNFLCNEVLFENVSDDAVIRVYNCISKEEFKTWYIIRGVKGIADLFTYYKIYK